MRLCPIHHKIDRCWPEIPLPTPQMNMTPVGSSFFESVFKPSSPPMHNHNYTHLGQHGGLSKRTNVIAPEKSDASDKPAKKEKIGVKIWRMTKTAIITTFAVAYYFAMITTGLIFAIYFGLVITGHI